MQVPRRARSKHEALRPLKWVFKSSWLDSTFGFVAPAFAAPRPLPFGFLAEVPWGALAVPLCLMMSSSERLIRCSTSIRTGHSPVATVRASRLQVRSSADLRQALSDAKLAYRS